MPTGRLFEEITASVHTIYFCYREKKDDECSYVSLSISKAHQGKLWLLEYLHESITRIARYNIPVNANLYCRY